MVGITTRQKRAWNGPGTPIPERNGWFGGSIGNSFPQVKWRGWDVGWRELGRQMPKAYSYVRMSTATQLQGDSLRRQLQASEDYAAANGLTIDKTLRLEDIGLSAFDGTNVERGGLGKFIDAVKSGQVEKGSTLIVESLDRISRQNVDVALRMFLDLLHRGISIVTLMDGRHYKPGKIDNIELISSILIMSRANEESVTKSKRVGAAWQKNRDNIKSRNLTSKCPGWLVPKPDRKGFDLIQKHVAIVRRIFTEAADLGMGADLIARRLNQERIPTFTKSNGLYKGYVHKILTTKAVIGEFQPRLRKGGKYTPTGEPIQNYYPRIIQDELFYRAQGAREVRRVGGAGRKGNGIANLFSGLLRCGTCSGPIHFLNKGVKEKWQYLLCGNAKRGLSDCFRGGWRYVEFETSFLTFIKEIDLATIALRPDNEMVRLANSIQETEGKLVEARSHRERAFALVLNDQPTDFLVKKFSEFDSTVAKLESDLEQLKQQQTSIAQRSQTFEDGKSGLSELVKKFQAGDESFSLRSTVAFHLRSIITEIRIFPGGANRKLLPEVEELMLTTFADQWSVHKSELPPMSAAARYFIVIFKDQTFRLVRPDANDPAKLAAMMASGEDWHRSTER